MGSLPETLESWKLTVGFFVFEERGRGEARRKELRLSFFFPLVLTQASRTRIATSIVFCLIGRFRARVSALKNAHSSTHCHCLQNTRSALPIESTKRRKRRVKRHQRARTKTTKSQQLEKRKSTSKKKRKRRQCTKPPLSAPLFPAFNTFILTVRDLGELGPLALCDSIGKRKEKRARECK